jgi:dienelactone hydrolase
LGACPCEIFFADYRPSYREPAAFELWPKMVSFFKTHLK